MDWWVSFLKDVGFPIAVASFVLLRLDRSVRKVHARIDAASEATNRRLAQIAFLLGVLVGPEADRKAVEFAGINAGPAPASSGGSPGGTPARGAAVGGPAIAGGGAAGEAPKEFVP